MGSSDMRKTKTSLPARRLPARAGSELSIQIKPFGPGPAALDALAQRLLQAGTVRQRLQKARHRLLSLVLVEDEPEAKAKGPPPPPGRFRATIYDYTNNRTLLLEGRLDKPTGVAVSESGRQPLPSLEEFEEAVRLLARDQELGPALQEGRLRPYRPMPPLLHQESPDGRVERTLAVGLLPTGDGGRHEIVGVNLIRRSLVRFGDRTPPTAQAR